MYKLYYAPATCAMAVHVILNAIGANYELIKIEADANRSDEYRKLNPLGQVPVLIEDNLILRESAAIIIHLLDKFEHPLLPRKDVERTKAIQWLLFFNSTMHQAHAAYFLIEKNIHDKAVTAPVFDLISKRISKLWRYVEAEIHSEYICGSKPTAADILMTVIANWAAAIHPTPVIGEKTKAICRDIIKLPYFAQALESESVKMNF